MFKVKYHSNGLVAQYKVRLIAHGLSQIHRIDFNKTFSPIMRKESLRLFLVIFYLLRLLIDQVNIVGIYLKGLLIDNDLPIFMKLPLEIKSFRAIREELITHLLHSIYDFRQSRKLWNQKVIIFFIDFDFVALNANLNILIRHDKEGITMVSVCVDNFFLILK